MTNHNKQIVADYFNRIGLETAVSSEQFWNRIKANHGQNTYDKMIQIISARTNELEIQEENIYESKNENLTLSLDFAGLTADFTKQFLEWITDLNQLKHPAKILEIGCDNGITACFLAMNFPDSEVVGIDISQNGILRAKELANQLGLTNISFVSGDFRNFSQEQQNTNKFDVIISLRTMHEMISQQMFKDNYSTELFINELQLQADPIINSIKQLLKNESSIYISCERLPNVHSYAFWSELLRKSELYVDWYDTSFNHSVELSKANATPIFVSTGTNTNISTFDGLIHLYSKEGNENNNFETGIIAEKSFNQLTEQEFQGGVQIDWRNGSGSLRLECWTDAFSTYLYKYDKKGNRELIKYKLEDLDEVLFEIEMYLAKNTNPDNSNVFDYESIEEREELL